MVTERWDKLLIAARAESDLRRKVTAAMNGVRFGVPLSDLSAELRIAEHNLDVVLDELSEYEVQPDVY